MLAVGQTGQVGQTGLLQENQPTIIILSITPQYRLRKIYPVSCSTKTCRPIYTHDIQILKVKGSSVTNWVSLECTVYKICIYTHDRPSGILNMEFLEQNIVLEWCTKIKHNTSL